MSKFQLISGPVSHVNYFAKNTGSIDRLGRSSGIGSKIPSRHKVSFKIGDRLAFFQGTPNLGAGDVVTAVGVEQDGELAISMFVNESTGIKYADSRTILLRYLGGSVAICLAIVLLVKMPLVAVLLAGLGIWSILVARKKKQKLDQLIFSRHEPIEDKLP
jgi:hypothetical protein